eukprot:Gb_40684 [translate_table: standard]
MSDTTNAEILTPCAACKMQRRKCSENCVLAPYFPPDNPDKFAIVHGVFGTSNVIKLLKVTDIPTHRRADAVNSIVYEATERQRDPIHGCTGIICQLQQQVSELQSQLQAAREELVSMTLQQTYLLTINDEENDLRWDALDPLQAWEPLWK